MLSVADANKYMFNTTQSLLKSSTLARKVKFQVLRSIRLFSQIQVVDQDYTGPLCGMHHLNHMPFGGLSNSSR